MRTATTTLMMVITIEITDGIVPARTVGNTVSDVGSSTEQKPIHGMMQVHM